LKRNELLELIMDSMKDPVVFADNNHIIKYMNRAAVSHYKKGTSLLGSSLLNCHNAESVRIITEVHERMKDGLEEELISDNERHRVFMRAVKDREGNLIGYYERFEPPVSD